MRSPTIKDAPGMLVARELLLYLLPASGTSGSMGGCCASVWRCGSGASFTAPRALGLLETALANGLLGGSEKLCCWAGPVTDNGSSLRRICTAEPSDVGDGGSIGVASSGEVAAFEVGAGESERREA